ncbi:MAG: hypothetical protein J2P13_09935 [Acidobacteria bacterium]|nr:hypothetical protein [Acidobacteriota bacterium]
MSSIFSPERYGRPQFIAGVMLVIFVGECAWLVGHLDRSATGEAEFLRLEEGLAQWRFEGIAGTPSGRSPLYPGSGGGLYDREHSPLWYLVASAPIAIFRVQPDSSSWIWLTRAPFIAVGALLGASLWYVARRLYGNAGGYIALGLYCFSPAVLRSSALWAAEPNIAPAWGAFGAVFTGIAVSHTLYAPREVVLWNWRRIVLLGVSLALAIGSHFSLVVVVPMVLGFMFYLAPERKRAAAMILAAACVTALVLLSAAYFFHLRLFLGGLGHAGLVDGNWQSAKIPGAYVRLVREIASSGPVLLLLVPGALAAYLMWPRTRYFGNQAPLIVAVLFLLLRLFSPHYSGGVFSLTAVVFLFVFVAGIAADLLETRSHELAAAVVAGLLAANALWALSALARIGR